VTHSLTCVLVPVLLGQVHHLDVISDVMTMMMMMVVMVSQRDVQVISDDWPV